MTVCPHGNFVQHGARDDARAWVNDPGVWCPRCNADAERRDAERWADTGPHMLYRREAVEFTWTGGPYINLDCADPINVWDYAQGRTRIPVTLDAFRAECDAWIAANEEE